MSFFTGVPEDVVWDRISRVVSTIPNAHNQELAMRYLRERAAFGIKTSTLGTDVNHLRAFCQFLGAKDLDQVVRDDIVRFVTTGKAERMWRNVRQDGAETITKASVRIGPATMKMRKISLRAFYKWLHQTDGTPPEFQGIKNHTPVKDQIPTDELITKQDLLKLIQAREHPKDKALIAFLYESGFRASEVCALNVGSVKFDQKGAVVTIPKDAPGLKSGARQIRIFDAVTYVQAWYEAHPKREDPSAAFFYSMSNRAPGARLTANAIFAFVKATGERAGIKKKLHPHLFRHSAATERARLGWKEAEMRAFFGWSRSSDMPATYVHLAGQDFEAMELERRGLNPGEPAKPALTPLICGRCNTANLPTAMFCGQCRNAVSPFAEEAARKEEDAKFFAVAERVWKLKQVDFPVAVREAGLGYATYRELPLQNSAAKPAGSRSKA